MTVFVMARTRIKVVSARRWESHAATGDAARNTRNGRAGTVVRVADVEHAAAVAGKEIGTERS